MFNTTRDNSTSQAFIHNSIRWTLYCCFALPRGEMFELLSEILVLKNFTIC